MDLDFTTSRLTETPLSAPFSSWAVRALTCCSTSSQSSSTLRVDERPDREPLGASIATCRRLLASFRVVRRGRDADRRLARLGPMLHRRAHKALDRGRGTADRELLEEESELLVVRGSETRFRLVRQIPETTLERTQRLLGRLVE